MIFGEKPAQTIETDRFQLMESDYLTLESLSFQVDGANPGGAQIRLVVAYGKKTGEVQVGGQTKNLFEKWESRLLLGSTLGQIEAALIRGVTSGALSEEDANQLLVDLSATHESLVGLAERLLQALEASDAVRIDPVVARVTPK